MHPVFEKLHPAIQRALAKHNFTEPTEPQIKAIPAVLDEESILIAPTLSVSRSYDCRVGVMRWNRSLPVSINPDRMALKARCGDLSFSSKNHQVFPSIFSSPLTSDTLAIISWSLWAVVWWEVSSTFFLLPVPIFLQVFCLRKLEEVVIDFYIQFDITQHLPINLDILSKKW